MSQIEYVFSWVLRIANVVSLLFVWAAMYWIAGELREIQVTTHQTGAKTDTLFLMLFRPDAALPGAARQDDLDDIRERLEVIEPYFEEAK